MDPDNVRRSLIERNVNRSRFSRSAINSRSCFLRRLNPHLVLLSIYFLISLLFYYYYQDDFLVDTRTDAITDGFYYYIVTFTTVGFGDLTPNTKSTKIFACLFVILGVGLLYNWFTLEVDKLYHWVGVYYGIRVSSFWKKKIGVALLFALLIVGTISFMTLEENDLIDSIYLSIVSASTVGYGDKHFTSRGGRWFACLWTLAAAWLVPKVISWFGEDSNVKIDQPMALRILKKLQERGKTTADEINEICMEIQAEDSHSVRVDDFSSQHGTGSVPVPDTSHQTSGTSTFHAVFTATQSLDSTSQRGTDSAPAPDTSHQTSGTSSFPAVFTATQSLDSTSHRHGSPSTADASLPHQTSSSSLSDHSSDDAPLLLPVSTDARTLDSTSHTREPRFQVPSSSSPDIPPTYQTSDASPSTPSIDS